MLGFFLFIILAWCQIFKKKKEKKIGAKQNLTNRPLHEVSDSKGHTNPQAMNGSVKGRDRRGAGTNAAGQNWEEPFFRFRQTL